jgi:hypothetical protein
MAETVNKVMEENPDEIKAVLAIQKMVTYEIGTWNLPLEYTAFKCRAPEEVWNSNAGTPLEKNILLATLLIRAGFSAVPVAIIPDRYYDREVGSLYIFQGFAVRVMTGSGEAVYISATGTSSQSLAYGEAGKKFLLLDGAIESLKTYDTPSGSAGLLYSGDLSLNSHGELTGDLNVTLSGNANPYFSLLQDSAYAKRYGAGAKDAVLIKLSIQESLFDLHIDKENAFEQYGEYVFMDVPASGSGISSWGFNYIETGRQTPIKLKEPIREQYQYKINLPDGFTLISPVVDINIDNPLGSVRISLKQDKNTLLVTRKIELKKDLVQYSEFEAFDELWKAWMNPSLNKMVFRTAD